MATFGVFFLPQLFWLSAVFSSNFSTGFGRKTFPQSFYKMSPKPSAMTPEGRGRNVKSQTFLKRQRFFRAGGRHGPSVVGEVRAVAAGQAHTAEVVAREGLLQDPAAATASVSTAAVAADSGGGIGAPEDGGGSDNLEEVSADMTRMSEAAEVGGPFAFTSTTAAAEPSGLWDVGRVAAIAALSPGRDREDFADTAMRHGVMLLTSADIVIPQGPPDYGDGPSGSGGPLSGSSASAVVAAGVPAISDGPRVAPGDGGVLAGWHRCTEAEEAQIAAEYNAWDELAPTESSGSSEAEEVY